MQPAPKRRRGERGPSPLSPNTRRRLLAGLLRQAEDGDPAAAGVLILVSARLEVAKAARAGQPEHVAAA